MTPRLSTSPPGGARKSARAETPTTGLDPLHGAGPSWALLPCALRHSLHSRPYAHAMPAVESAGLVETAGSERSFFLYTW